MKWLGVFYSWDSKEVLFLVLIGAIKLKPLL